MANGWTAQTWEGHTLLSEIDGLSFDAAHEIARTALLTGHMGRVIPPDLGSDRWTVYDARGVRTGRFDQVTLVRVMGDSSEAGR